MNAAAASAADPAPNRPLIVCGMHRSGTSLLASLLAGAGLHLGDELLESSAANAHGHFEDVGILEFHRHVLLANGIVSEGYTTQTGIEVPAGLRREATALVAARAASRRAWGWKEPRTTLFLDFWSALLPDARYLLVFRRPWEVVDSLFRRNEKTFHYNPAFAIDVWAHYNRLLLEFARRHPDTTVLLEASQVIAEPDRLFESIRRKFAVPLGDPPARYDAALFREDDSPSRPALLMAACPAAYDLYLELRDLAGSASPLPDDRDRGLDSGRLQTHLLSEWSRSTHHLLRCRDAEQLLQTERAWAAGSRRGWRRLLGIGRRRPKAA